MIDITPPLSPETAVWPGDVAFRREVALSIEAGDNLELSSIHSTVHVGAHADAPSHYAAGGQTIEQRDLGRYIGPCQVMHVDVSRGHRVTPDDLSEPIQAPRLLLATGTFPDPQHFNTDFAALSPALIDHVAAQGVHLIGIDTPSVDLFDDKRLASHNAIARHDMAILEGLVLANARPGTYQLIALPLPLVGADASPVRAVLVP